MYHLNITEAFKKYTKKHSLQKNINQEDLIKTLDTLTEQLKPSFLKSVKIILWHSTLTPISKKWLI